MNLVIDDPSDLTPKWCTNALHTGGLDVTVAMLDVEPIGTGQTGSAYRLTAAYALPPPGARSTLIAKLGAGSIEARRRVGGGYRKEVEFYRQLASTVHVRTPRCWYAGIADDNLSFTLLLDEVANARPGVQAAGCSVRQAMDVVENAAALHAPRWNDRALLSMDFLSPVDPDRAAFLADLARRSTTHFVARYGDALTKEERMTLHRSAEQGIDWLLARPAPFALLHGDYRLDNFMFDVERLGVTVLDWQTVTVGAPLRDVAYLLGNSLPTEVRRAEESEIVEHYHAELLRRGVTGYDLASCFDDYRLGQFHGPFITVIGAVLATAERSATADAMFLTMARRCCAAIQDLYPFSLL